MVTPKLIVTLAYAGFPFGIVGEDSDHTPQCGLDTPTSASCGVVFAAPLDVIRLVESNSNEGGMTALTTTPEALPGPRFCTSTWKSASVAPGVYEAPNSEVNVMESCAVSELHEVTNSTTGARSERARMPVRWDARARTRPLRETVRPCWRCEAAQAGAAAASRSA